MWGWDTGVASSDRLSHHSVSQSSDSQQPRVPPCWLLISVDERNPKDRLCTLGKMKSLLLPAQSMSFPRELSGGSSPQKTTISLKSDISQGDSKRKHQAEAGSQPGIQSKTWDSEKSKNENKIEVNKQ